MFNIWVKIRDFPLKSPREHDGWLMIMLGNAGYSVDELICLNRVQCHQKELFYLDIFDAGGRRLDRRYLTKRLTGTTWSWLIFPPKKPQVRDFCLWISALESIAHRGCPQHQLGRLIDLGHKVLLDPVLTMNAVRSEAPPTLFWDVLQRWERTWMWDNIQWIKDDNWIVEAIRDGSCIAVTDGLYMKALYLQIHSAAFV